MVKVMPSIFMALVIQFLLAQWVLAGQYIYLAPEKYVYPYPMEGSIGVVGYLRGLEPGTPVDIRVSLELPGGNVTFLDAGLEFHPGSRFLVEDFPFVSMPVARLLEVAPDAVYNGTPSTYPGTQLSEFMPGKYILRTEISGPGITDRSEVPFWVIGADLLPSIADTPRPIIQEVDPPYGGAGDEITIRGLKLHGDPGVVDPGLVDQMLVQVTIGDAAQGVTYLADNGTVLRFRIAPGTASGDLKVHLVLPYWVEDSQAMGHLPVPRVVEVTSNPWPFYVEPVITSIDPLDFGPGDSIEIKGMNFSTDPALNQVFFGGVPATVTEATNTTMSVSVPAISASGDQGIAIQVVANGVAGPTYIAAYEPTRIYSVHPLTLAPGGTLRVYGKGFGDDTKGVAAFLGAYVLGVDSANDTSLVLSLPSHMAQGRYPLKVLIAGHETLFNRDIEVTPSW